MNYIKIFLRNTEIARSKRYLHLSEFKLHILTGFLIGYYHLKKILFELVYRVLKSVDYAKKKKKF